MKKLIALLLSLIMLFALCACSKSEPSIGMPNPTTECASLDEVNEAVGGSLSGPATMGVSDEAYFVIDCGSYKIGEYQFKVNGYDYTMRCANTEEDISGVYLSGKDGTAFSSVVNNADGMELPEGIAVYFGDESAEDGGMATGDSGLLIASDGKYKCARWFVDGMQYILTVNDAGELESETFVSIASEFAKKTEGNL